jgi:hypothetical protein
MKTRLFASLTALTLSAFAGTSAQAEDSAVTLEWQRPGYVMDVVVVTAPRPTAASAQAQANAGTQDIAATGTVALAWQEPAYVEEVVVVTASRSAVLAEFRAATREAWIARAALTAPATGSWKNWAGAPAR